MLRFGLIIACGVLIAGLLLRCLLFGFPCCVGWLPLLFVYFSFINSVVIDLH